MRTIVTKTLRTFYSHFMRFGFQFREARQRTVDSIAGGRRLRLWHSFYRRLTIAFYVQFLIAMCKQSKGYKICHLVRLRSYRCESATQVDRAMEIPSLRAA